MISYRSLLFIATAMNDDDLFNFLINFGNVSDNLIILDDFNFSDITWDTLSDHSPDVNQCCDMIFQAN